MELTKDIIVGALGAAAAGRGYDYWRAGWVVELEQIEDFGWEATVEGSQPHPYTTHVSLRHHGSKLALKSATCSCPLGGNCKHAAAVLFAIAEEAGNPLDDDEMPPLAAQTDEDREAAPLSASAWLEAAAAAAAPLSELPSVAASEGQDIAYVLTPATTGSVLTALSLEFLQAKRRRGAIISWKKLEAVRDWSRYQASSNPEDTAIRQQLRINAGGTTMPARYYYGSYGYAAHDPSEYANPRPLRGPHVVTMLRVLLQSGRCHWRTVGTALRWGGARRVGLRWALHADGRQRLALDMADSVRLLAFDPSCYIDEQADLVGTLHLAFPEGILRLLDSAPALAVDEVQAFCDALPASLRDTLPMPTLRNTATKEVAPLPVLVVTAEKLPVTDASVLLGRLDFAYDGVVVRSADTQEVLHQHADDTLVRMPRQLAAERDLARVLQELGCSPAPESMPAHDVLIAPVPDMQAFYAVTERVLTPLRAAGWQVVGDVDLDQKITAIDAPWDVELTGDIGSPWFGVDMGIDVGGERIALLPVLLHALRQPELGLSADAISKIAQPRVFVPIDDTQVISLPTDRLRQVMGVLEELFNPRPRLGVEQARDLLEMAEGGACNLHGGESILTLARRLRACTGVQPVAPPVGLKAELRPYQLQGLSWLQFLREFRLAGILADDMGLGKTIQTLAHILCEKEAGRLHSPVLIVAPTSLLFNWHDELSRFAPGLTAHVLHGADRHRLRETATVPDVILTTYGIVVRDIEVLAEIQFYLVVLDESQAIKNSRAKLSHAVRRLLTEHRLCLSGTPMQNHLGELWAHFAFLMPGLLEDADTFREQFRTPIEKENDPRVRLQLSRRIRPFLLRRTKDEVTRDLPAKTEIIQMVRLEGAQRDLYETVRMAMDDRIRAEVSARGLARSSIVVLDALLKLRQACCDPRLVKLVAANRVRASAKLEALMELLPPLLVEGRRILVFSQFTSMLDLIGEELTQQQIAFVTLTGQTTDRQAAVETFQRGDAPVFLISLKAGGVGLNLTRADTVIHYDPWWNSAAEQQATDRAHRIGQDKPVFVYKLIAAGSVEERILEMQRRKQQLTAALLGQGQHAQPLTTEDLQLLLAPLSV